MDDLLGTLMSPAAVGAAGIVMCYCAMSAKASSSVESLPLRLRLRLPGPAAVIGCLTADAAAATSHWCYDQAELAEKVAKIGGEKNAPFISPAICPFYHVKAGEQSCYGQHRSTPSPQLDLPGRF